MLEELPIEGRETDLIRLARGLLNTDKFCEQQGLNERDRGEVVKFLESRTARTTKELVDQIFNGKPRLAKATRFSDGSFPVLYGAVDPRTAEAEVKHWFSKHVSGKPAGERTVWYTRFTYSPQTGDISLREV